MTATPRYGGARHRQPAPQRARRASMPRAAGPRRCPERNFHPARPLRVNDWPVQTTRRPGEPAALLSQLRHLQPRGRWCAMIRADLPGTTAHAWSLRGSLPADDLACRVPGEVGQRGQSLLLTAGGVGDDQPERAPSGVHGGVRGRHRDVDHIALGDREFLVRDGLRASP